MTRDFLRVAAGVILITACGESAVTLPESPAPPELTAAQLGRLSSQRIFFGHQSVGGNIMDGVVQLAESGAPVPFTPVRTLEVDSSRKGVLAHEWLGENGLPESKLAALDSAIRGPAAGADVVLFKFCYSDFNRDTDPGRLFAEYLAEVRALRALRPDLTMIHVTTPVPEPDDALRYLLRRVRGRMTLKERIGRIEEYNDLLRAEFAGREPLFDLARLESQGPDGSRATIAPGGRILNVLNPAWSEDGSHLNPAGRLVIAGELLAFLADSVPLR